MKFAKNFELFSLACFPRPPRLSVGVRVPLARRLASPAGRRAFGTRSTPRLGSSSAPAGRSPGRVAVGAYPAFFFFVSPVPAGFRSSRLPLRQAAVVPLSRPGHGGPAGASRAAGLEAHRDRPVLEADRDQAAPPAVDQRNRNARPGQRAGRLIAGASSRTRATKVSISPATQASGSATAASRASTRSASSSPSRTPRVPSRSAPPAPGPDDPLRPTPTADRRTPIRASPEAPSPSSPAGGSPAPSAPPVRGSTRPTTPRRTPPPEAAAAHCRASARVVICGGESSRGQSAPLRDRHHSGSLAASQALACSSVSRTVHRDPVGRSRWTCSRSPYSTRSARRAVAGVPGSGGRYHAGGPAHHRRTATEAPTVSTMTASTTATGSRERRGDVGVTDADGPGRSLSGPPSPGVRCPG